MKRLSLTTLGILLVSQSAQALELVQGSQYYACDNGLHLFQVPFKSAEGNVRALWYGAISRALPDGKRVLTHEMNHSLEVSDWVQTSDGAWHSRTSLNDPVTHARFEQQVWLRCEEVGRGCSFKFYSFKNSRQTPIEGISCKESNAEHISAKVYNFRFDAGSKFESEALIANFAGNHGIAVAASAPETRGDAVYFKQLAPAQVDIYGDNVSFHTDVWENFKRPVPQGREIGSKKLGTFRFVGTSSEDLVNGQVFVPFSRNAVGSFSLTVK